jgi:hypothetical protein
MKYKKKIEALTEAVDVSSKAIASLLEETVKKVKKMERDIYHPWDVCRSTCNSMGFYHPNIAIGSKSEDILGRICHLEKTMRLVTDNLRECTKKVEGIKHKIDNINLRITVLEDKNEPKT